MVQDEVASRLVAEKGSKDYGSLSVLIKYYSISKYEFKVSRNCFYPMPHVDSAIISMRKEKKDYNLDNEAKFLKFVQDIFSMRRKTLLNNICNKYVIEKSIAETKLKEIGLDAAIRSEELDINQIVSLYKSFSI